MPVNNNLAGILPAEAGFGLGYVHPSPVVLPWAPYPYTADGYEQVLAEKRAAEQREERMWRQRYAESAFDNAAKSPAGAVGAFQIMPITYKDYLERGKGKPGDLTDPAYNRKVRDFVLGIIPRDLGSLWSKESPEEINLAKRYAAYNWGAGSLRSYLRKKQKEGVDIHNSLDWMGGLPKETRDYVNFIVFNQDVPDTSKVADLYQAAREKYNFATGGRLRKLVQHINETSNADFVKRLLDEKRAVLKNDDGTVSTHELGYVTEGDRAVVFPFVQNTDNGLVRFTMPDALNRAVERGDTLQMSVPEAELFTKKYKKYYPGFHSYDGDSEPTGQMMLIGEDGNPIDVLPGAVSTFNILSDYNRRQVKRLARNDYANVGEKTRDFDKDWQERVYNRAWNRADREYRNQENRKALRRAAIQELQTGVPTGAFNEYTKEGIEDMSPFAMGLVLSAAGPALGGLRTVGDMAKAAGKVAGVAGRGAAKGLEWIGEKAMPSALLKSPVWRGATARAFQAAAPYVDAAELSYWSALAGNTAYNAIRNKDLGTASASGTMALLPLVPAAAGAVGRAKNLLNSVKRLPDVDKSLELQYKLASGVSPEELLTSDLISSYADVPFLSATNARKARAAAEASRAAAEAVPAPARVAGAEWSPEELARLQAMAGTQQMDLSAYTPEQIAQAQAQMQADAPIIHDALAGNRATGAAERFISSGPVAGAKMASGYQIERYPGYMLKSLMEGNPLEKQLSKAGEINVDNLRNYMKSKDIKNVDKAVMEKVLASDEFAGKKSIDYNKFRKAVQDELITYERTPDTRWENYGMDRIGVSTVDTDSNWKYWKGLYLEERQNPKTGLWEYFDENGNLVSEADAREMFLKDALGNRYGDAAPSTYVFSSARIPNGSDKHYDANTIGNVRTYTTADEPEVLHVMESQSDWAQSGKATSRSEIENQIASLKQSLAMQEENLKNNGRYFAPKVRNDVERNIDYLKEQVAEYSARLKDAEQSGYLKSNYTSRQIQENLRYAAEKGQTKMRYPTRETAAKIEGYPKQTKYYTKEGSEVKDPYVYPDDVAEKIAGIQDEMERLDTEILGNSYPRTISDVDFYGVQNDKTSFERLLAAVKEDIVRNEKWMKDFGYADVVNGRVEKYKSLFNTWAKKFETVYKEAPEIDGLIEESRAASTKRSSLSKDINELLRTPRIINKNLVSKDIYLHEDILRKYSDFPKQFKKLYKNADVRVVTDPKGNTWYEVDVPENYLKQEWAYADGGLLNKLSAHYGGDTEPTGQMSSLDRRRASGGFIRKYTDGTPGTLTYSEQQPVVPNSPVKFSWDPGVNTTENIAVPLAAVNSVQSQDAVVEPRHLTIPEEAPSNNADNTLLHSVPDVDMTAAVVSIPQRDTASYFADVASGLVDEALRNEEEQKEEQFNPAGRSANEIRAIQRKLAEEGYYQDYLTGKSASEIKALQLKMINKGLLSNRKNPDGTYAEADGIAGKRTLAAWDRYNIDGKWGRRTESAYNIQQKKLSPGSNKWDADFMQGIDGCARWVTRKFESVMGGTSRQNGVYGNAWQMPLNIANSGGRVLFNIYDDDAFKGVSSAAEVKSITKQKLASASPDLSVLRPGDVVGIYFPSSKHFDDAIKEGTTYNTHVGMVIDYASDGTPIIQHNMGGNERRDRADRLPFSSKITVASRPASSSVGTYPWKTGESKYEVDLPEKFEKRATEESRNNLKTYMDSMAGAADTIGKIYTNADMDSVQKIATAVLRRETGFMQNTESSRTGWDKAKVLGERLLRNMFTDVTPETKSSNLSKFKLATLSPNERIFLGITSAEDLEKPEKAGLASMYVLAKNYDYFVRYAQENPQLNLTKQDIEDLTALSYNQGMRRLYSVGTEEVDGELRVAPSKLEAIRAAAASDEVIDDFKATKLARVASEFPALTDLMHELYDRGLGERSSSYMNAARQAIQNIREKNAAVAIR